VGAGCWRALAQRARRAAGPGWMETGRRLGRAAGRAACVEFLGRRTHARSPPLSLFPAACGAQECAHRPVTAGRESGGPGVVLLSQKGENGGVPTPTLNPAPSLLLPVQAAPCFFRPPPPPFTPTPAPLKAWPGSVACGRPSRRAPPPFPPSAEAKKRVQHEKLSPLDLRPPHHSFHVPACQCRRRVQIPKQTAQKEKRNLPRKGFEPSPLRTAALMQHLRPLDHLSTRRVAARRVTNPPTIPTACMIKTHFLPNYKAYL